MITKTRILSTSIIIVPIILLATLPLYDPGYYVSLAITILMYAVIGVSWIIFSGYTGYISLATAAFYGIGGYMTVLLWPRLPFPLLIIIGGLASAIFAILVGFPCLRIRGPYFVILTLGLSELVKHTVTMYEVRIKGDVGTMLHGTPSMVFLYYSLLLVGIIAVVTAHVIKNSKFGLGLLSIKGDEEAAEAMGVNTTKYKISALAISSLFMGCVGAIITLRWTYIEPHIIFSPVTSFQVIIMAVLGGWEDFRGPILGALTLTLISEAFGVRFPYHYMIFLGIILIIVIKFVPMGLIGAAERLRMRENGHDSV